jgi:nucleoid-associated protein YgaU
MTTSKARIFAAACAALALSACDRAQREEFKAERADKLYQDAVADYNAGRIVEARLGFENVVRADPSNASARFQLAVLLQDAGLDYLGAMCCYRDYVMLAPGSDKAPLAKDRLAECERLYTVLAAQKMNLTDNSEVTAERDKAKEELAGVSAALAAATAKLADAEARLATAEREIGKMRSVLKRMGEDEDLAAAPRAVRPAGATDTDDASSGPRRIDAAALAQDDPEAPLTMNEEAKALFEEEEREEAALAAANAETTVQPSATRRSALPPFRQLVAPMPYVAMDSQPRRVAVDDGGDEERGAPSVLPAQTDSNRAPQRLTEIARGMKGGDMDGSTPALRPETYVVQEGETLSLIALKFYGKRSAWPKIQAANRATVSVDGKVRAGQTLVLP